MTDNFGWAGPEARQPPPRRRWRRGRRAGLTAGGAVLAAVVAVAVLLGVTPSAAGAPELVRAQVLAHGGSYPGPPVPDRFAAALVATEDHRFYSEPGVDPLALARVTASWVTGGGDQGGSTLEQQLAKMLYTPTDSGLNAKLEQVALAVKLARSYSKAEILAMYAEVAYFGHGFYGLTAASCGYFGIPPAELSWGQAALLAGLMPAPSADDPLLHPAQARARELHVLSRLAATGVLSPAQVQAAAAWSAARGAGAATNADPVSEAGSAVDADPVPDADPAQGLGLGRSSRLAAGSAISARNGCAG